MTTRDLMMAAAGAVTAAPPVELPPDAMALEINTALGDLTFFLPLRGTVNVTVDWGDGSSESTTTAGLLSHTYATNGVYTILITGTLTAFGFDGGTTFPNSNTRPELTKCLQWGSLGITDLSAAFAQCPNLTYVPNELPPGVFTLVYMFYGCSSFNSPINNWDTSSVTDISYTFALCTSFNQPIGSWDTSKVDQMIATFSGASVFNQNLTTWCVGNFSTTPSGFAQTSFQTANRPIWGTCPSHVAAGNITLIGSASGTNTATLPAHQPGDVILAFVYRDGASTQPTMPAGWTSLDVATNSTTAARIAYRVAISSSTLVGTWTNASTVIFLIYRGVYVPGNFISLDTEGVGTGTTVNYPANGFWQGLSAVVRFAANATNTSTLETPPSGASLMASQINATTTTEAVAFDYGSSSVGDLTATAVRVGVSALWTAFTIRLRVPITKV